MTNHILNFCQLHTSLQQFPNTQKTHKSNQSHPLYTKLNHVTTNQETQTQIYIHIKPSNSMNETTTTTSFPQHKFQHHPTTPFTTPTTMSTTQSEKQALFITSLIIFWYSSNIGVLLLNKLLLSNYGFSFPIFLTMCHMSACAVLSYVSIVFLKIVPFQRIKSRSQFFRIATLSIVFCGSVVGGNISLRYLPVSFNQAVGATTPFFTALFAYLITLKREAWITYGCLVPVVAGVVIASGFVLMIFKEADLESMLFGSFKNATRWCRILQKLFIFWRNRHSRAGLSEDSSNIAWEPSFHLYGFINCIGATAARAFKSVLQGVLLSSEGEKLNSMNLLLYMSPIAVLVLLPATLVMEPNVIDVTTTLATEHRYLGLLILVNSAMAYGANLLNFLVTKHTSALTLQVLGNAKGAVAVVISILLFRNPVTFIGIAGYTMTVMGVVAYGEAKRRYK